MQCCLLFCGHGPRKPLELCNGKGFQKIKSTFARFSEQFDFRLLQQYPPITEDQIKKRNPGPCPGFVAPYDDGDTGFCDRKNRGGPLTPQ
jgi:hypothetical protein